MDDVRVRAVCGVLALDAMQRVLLVRRADGGTWALPGGGVEAGETWLEAAQRECLEETGWRVAVTALFGLYSDPATQMHSYGDGTRTQFVGAVFLAELVERVADPDDEVLEARLFEQDALPLPIFPPDAPVLRDFVSGRHPPVIA